MIGNKWHNRFSLFSVCCIDLICQEELVICSFYNEKKNK